MDLRTYAGQIRRYWRTFTLVALTVSVAGVAAILFSPQRFESTTRLLVSLEGASTAAAYQNDDVIAGRVSTYIPLLSSGVVAGRVIDELQLPMRPEELAAQISATNVPPRTALIDVTVADESPQRAQRIAETLADQFISYTKVLETPTGEDDQKVHTTVVTAASQPTRNVVDSVLLGLLVCAAAVLAGAVAVWIRCQHDPPRMQTGHVARHGHRVDTHPAKQFETGQTQPLSDRGRSSHPEYITKGMSAWICSM